MRLRKSSNSSKVKEKLDKHVLEMFPRKETTTRKQWERDAVGAHFFKTIMFVFAAINWNFSCK